jgi:hypothetical protein
MTSPVNRIAIEHGERFSFGGENLVISVNIKDTPPSTSEALYNCKERALSSYLRGARIWLFATIPP